MCHGCAVGVPRVCTWMCHGYAHGCAMGVLWCAKGVPWVCHGCATGVPWVCHGCAHGRAMGVPRVCVRVCRGRATGVPWVCHGCTRGCEVWVCYGCEVWVCRGCARGQPQAWPCHPGCECLCGVRITKWPNDTFLRLCPHHQVAHDGTQKWPGGSRDSPVFRQSRNL